MLANFHTHTTFCDGKNTPEEMILAALEKGFTALGFSGHGYTYFDFDFCMMDTDSYIAEIKRLQEKYKKDIRIYLGVEEDCHQWVDRSAFEYMIGSCHYIYKDGVHYSLDAYVGCQDKCAEAFGNDAMAMAQAYYSTFCDYIRQRKPDIIGHFDIITKYEEVTPSRFLSNPQYHKMAEEFLLEAVKSGCVFEVNMGAMSRGYRTSCYPADNLLHILKKENARIILSSDCHNTQALDAYFAETKDILRDVGFTHTYTLSDNGFVPVAL